MIFKKPYAFLIKYFKLINWILTILFIYIFYRTYNIVSFFNTYIKEDYSGNFYTGFSDTYISSFVYLIIILIIFGLLAIFILLIYKKKPIKTYLSSIIYYIILFIFLKIIKNVMISLEGTVLTAEMARIYRDLSMISIIPQGVFILLFVLRAFGLNIGKFNFKDDLKELEISEKDNEEVELTLKRDGVKFRRNIRRFGREFVYYLKENKFIFIIICIILVISMCFLIYKLFPNIIDLNFNQGQEFQINSINFKVEDSIITNLDYKGDIIDENNYYLVVKLSIENLLDEDLKYDYNDFRLIIKDSFVYPSVDKSVNFIDYAILYSGNKVKSNSKQTYSLVFEINEEDIDNNYKLKIANGSVVSEDKKVGKFNYVTITPIVINNVVVEENKNLGDEINFSNSNLGNTTLTLSNLEITSKYIYDYKYCIKDNCINYKDVISIDYTKNGKLLMVLDYNYNLDNSISYYKHSTNIKTFINDFVKLRYEEEDKAVYETVKDVTPSNLENKLVLEIPNKVDSLDSYYLSIIVRNKEYLIKLK